MPPLEPTTGHTLTAREFAKIRDLASSTFGLDLRAGKETLVSARLGKQMRETGCRSFDEYYRRVTDDSTGELLIHLIDALTTNHTSFFREPAHFDLLRTVLLPQWNERGCIEIWSAACSTGEEPYSIAMCLAEALEPVPPGKVRIVASDISTRVLANAVRGIYRADRIESLPSPLLHKYWLRGERDWSGSYRLKKEIRDMVEFRRLNLLESLSAMGTFPLIFCRNVMIYFQKPTQQQVVKQLAAHLEPGGYLFIGHAESLNGIRHSLEYVRPAVYRSTAPRMREKGRS